MSIRGVSGKRRRELPAKAFSEIDTFISRESTQFSCKHQRKSSKGIRSAVWHFLCTRCNWTSHLCCLHCGPAGKRSEVILLPVIVNLLVRRLCLWFFICLLFPFDLWFFLRFPLLHRRFSRLLGYPLACLLRPQQLRSIV